MGFTLVEMLVVLAVITILASITVPAVMRAQSMGRQTSCKNNLSQIGKGLFMYAHTWDRYFPANRPPPLNLYTRVYPPLGRGYDDLSPLYGIPAEREGTVVRTTSYIPDIHSFNCPSTRDNAGTLDERIDWWRQIRYKRTDKIWHFTQKGPVGSPVIPDPRPQLSYEYCGEYNPSLQYTRVNTGKAWLVHDEDGRNENTEAVQKNRDLSGLTLGHKSNHRTRGGNVLFADGRAEWLTRLAWPEGVMGGMEEWYRVTGWKLPTGRYETEEE